MTATKPKVRVKRRPAPNPRAAEALAALSKLTGSDARLASDPDFEVHVQQTGILPIDCLLYGGFAKGRISLLTGEFSTLKSFISLRTIASCQQAGGLAALVDAEKSFDPVWAARLGVDVSSLIVMRPTVGEDAQGVCETLLQDHDLDVMVWDSLASTMTAEQAEKASGETDKVATLARFINRSLLRQNAINRNCAIILINQLRTKIGVTYGTPVSFPGGKAQEFYAAQHIFMRRGEKIREDTKTYRLGSAKTVKRTAQQVYEAELAKSKVGGPPYRTTTILWDPNTGTIDELAFAIDAGLDLGLVTVNSTGTMFSYGELDAPKGKRFYKLLQANPDQARQLMSDVLFTACPNLEIHK